MKATVLVGALHFVFGLAVGGLGIFAAFRLLGRMLKLGHQQRAPGGTPAVQLFEAACLVSLAILVRDALTATFEVVDLLVYRRAFSLSMLGQLTLVGIEHLACTLAAGSAVLISGVWVFNRLTPEVDELEELKAGHLGPSIVLSAVIVSLALLCAPALRHVLNGLIPFPELPAGVVAPPS